MRQDRITRQSVALLEGEAAVARLFGLQGLVELRAARAAEVERLRAQGEEIERDQERIRRNLGAVPSNNALHGRLLQQLEAAETRMEGVRKSQEGARAAVEAAQRALEVAVAGFTL